MECFHCRPAVFISGGWKTPAADSHCNNDERGFRLALYWRGQHKDHHIQNNKAHTEAGQSMGKGERTGDIQNAAIIMLEQDSVKKRQSGIEGKIRCSSENPESFAGSLPAALEGVPPEGGGGNSPRSCILDSPWAFIFLRRCPLIPCMVSRKWARCAACDG